MIRHCSLWNFRDAVSSERLDEIATEFVAMAGEVPEVRHAECGRNLGPSEANFDLAAVMDFDALEGYAAYVANEAHIAFYENALA